MISFVCKFATGNLKTPQPNFTSIWSVRWSIWWLLKRSLPRSTFAIWLQLWIIWRLCTVVILGWNLSIVSIKVMRESVNKWKKCIMFRIKVTMRTQKNLENYLRRRDQPDICFWLTVQPNLNYRTLVKYLIS